MAGPLGPLPPVPDLQHRLEIIWRELVDPCDAPITVWIQYLWEPLLHAVLEWYAIDLLQVFVAYLRPARYRSVWRSSAHWKGGRKGTRGSWRRVWREIVEFDPSEYIGRHLATALELEGRPMAPGEVAIWTVGGAIERAAFWYFVLDLTSEFLYRWSSSVAQTRYCQARDAAVLWAHFDRFTQTGIFGWAAVLYPTTDKERNLSFWNNAGVSQSVGNGVVTARCMAKCIDGVVPTPFAGIRLRCLGGPSEGLISSLEIPGNTGSEFALSASAQFQPGDLWISEVIASGIWEFREGDYFVQTDYLVRK